MFHGHAPEMGFAALFAAREKDTQLNIDLKRENANAKVKTRAKKAEKKGETV
ncbi:MAG: hypothetical protein IKP09_03660 [Lentisphaeria bacterium]|nr:hypothetical protein [Lentisphaeria bacterium]